MTLTRERVRWSVGDRVQRQVDVFDPKSRLMHGAVVRVYAERGYPELYEVLWDGEAVPSPGYFWWGLDVEPRGIA